MNLDDVTPMILTWNEEENLHSTLGRLEWAQKVIVVDSYSLDSTLEIAKSFRNVEIHQRKFDHFSDQCNFGLTHVATPWVLSLDADYICPRELFDEISQINATGLTAFSAKFTYAVYGRKLRGGIYPPRKVLYLASEARYECDGHAHRVSVAGKHGLLNVRIIHDDRKPLSRWLNSQITYAQAEAEKINQADHLGWKDWIRSKVLFAPALTFFYCLFVRGLLLDGMAGIYYSLQRTFAELLLSIVLLDRKLLARIRED